MGRLGVVTGLSSEANCFSAAEAAGEARVLCTGAKAERAGAAARQLVEEGCAALVSFGLAGGLDDVLKPGDVILADGVICPDGRRFDTHPKWRKRIQGRVARGGEAVTLAAMAGSDYPLILPDEKADLRASSGAVAVDMESHAVAEVAFDLGLPFLILRAVVDSARRTVPSWVMDTVGDDGRVDPLKAAFEAICRPWDIPMLGLLAFESEKGLKSLRRVIALAGPRLGLD